MATLTIKNIPADLYQRIKESAEINRRSINREAIVCLERTVRSTQIEPLGILAKARELRRKTATHILTDQQLAEVKNAGRL